MRNHDEVTREVLSRRDELLAKRKSGGKKTALTLICVGVGAAVLLTSGVFFFGKGGENVPSGYVSSEVSREKQEESGEDFPEQSEEPLDFSVADWYLPGSLCVNAVMRNAPETPAKIGMLSAESKEGSLSEIADLAEGSFGEAVGARFVNVTELLQSGEHKDHGSVFFDTEKQEIVCAACLVKESLEGSRQTEEYSDREIVFPEKNVLIRVDEVTSFSRISFAIFDETQNRVSARYVLDTDTGNLYPIPVLSGNDIGALVCSPDMTTLLTFAQRKTDTDYDDAYLIDVESGEAVCISGGLPTFFTGEFSPDGKNVVVLLKNEYGVTNGTESEQCRFLLYGVDTGAHCEGEGKILSYANGLLITVTGGEYRVYDRETCQEIEPPAGTLVVEKKQNGEIVRTDLSTGSSVVLSKRAAAYLVSEDGKYLYLYSTGDEFVTCVSVETAESFYAEVDRKFVSETARLSDLYHIFYQMKLSDAKDELLVCYYTAEKGDPGEDQPDPDAEKREKLREAVRTAYERSSDIPALLNLLKGSEDYGSLSLSAYRGNGFLYLSVGNLGLGDNAVTFTEDYRSGTFTAYYDGDRHGTVAPYESEPGGRRTVACTSDAGKTEAFLVSEGISIGIADVDFAEFYENGKFSDEKARDYRLSDAYLSGIGYFSAFLWGNPGYECYDMQLLRAVLNEFLQCERKRVKVSHEYDYYGTLLFGNVRLILQRGEDGGFYLLRDEQYYEIPEWVFADFLGLCAYGYLRQNIVLTEPQTEIGRLFVGSGGNGEKLTLNALQSVLKGGVQADELKKYRCAVVGEANSVLVRVLFPVYGAGEEPDGFAVMGFASDGNAALLCLFDGSYRYCADLLCGDRAEFAPKGRISDGFGVWTFTEPADDPEDALPRKAKDLIESIRAEYGYISFGVLSMELRSLHDTPVSFFCESTPDGYSAEAMISDFWEGAFAAAVTFDLPEECLSLTNQVLLADYGLLLTLVPVGEPGEYYDLEVKDWETVSPDHPFQSSGTVIF